MRKVICCLLAVLLCMSLAVPAFAAEDDFVPSISYKEEPEIVPVPGVDNPPAIGILYDEDGNIIDYVREGCLVVTPVSEAKTSTEIPDDARALLLQVYEELLDGTMKLPYEENGLDPEKMVIRDLFDATFLCEEHPKMMADGKLILDITFDIGVAAGVEVTVMTYVDGVWTPIVKTVNNGDGTITCSFDKICPIVFCVPVGTNVPPSQTGDIAGNNLLLWVGLLLASAAAVTVLAVDLHRKNASK